MIDIVNASELETLIVETDNYISTTTEKDITKYLEDNLKCKVVILQGGFKLKAIVKGD